MANKKLNRKLAFSLIELSITILIIAVLMIAVMKGADLINLSRKTSAGVDTKDSPVNKISNLVVWYESTLDSSFKTSELKDGGTISQWNDMSGNNPTNPNNIVQNTTSKPQYITNGINGLPALRFESSYLETPLLNINNDKISVFIVTKRTSYVANASSVIAVGSDQTTDYQSEKSFVAFSENTSTNIITYRDNANRATNSNHPGNNEPYIATTIFDGSKNSLYINGKGANYASSGSFDNMKFYIGARYFTSDIQPSYYYKGDIGEIIIYKKALSDQERQDVEAYLSKKWSINITNNTTSNCLTYSDATCSSCNSGYTLSGGSCFATVSNCATYSASGCSSCNSGYTLSGGSCFATVSNCATYSGSGCSSCNSGYTLSGGSCFATVSNCATYSASGCSSCNSGYTLSGGSCFATVSNCATYSASGCSSCNSGYVLSGGSCSSITCSATAGTGYLAKSGLPYAQSGSGSFACDDNGYTGTVSYTCTTNGAATITGGTCSKINCTSTSTSTPALAYTEDTNSRSGKIIRKFTAGSGTFTCPKATNVEVLVVAGGGGGGSGGGGGGGLIHNSSFAISANTDYNISVGAGGTGGTVNNSLFATSGNSSAFGPSTANGGGGGGPKWSKGRDGGSGGGGGIPSSSTSSGGARFSGQGNSGGSSSNAGSCSAGGGGGASGAGGSGSSLSGGNGGAGISYSITGTETFYAGGGGGSRSSSSSCNTVGYGSSGSGGGGGAGSSGTSGTANTGGGGGGASSGNGGNGGSGVVIVVW